MRFAANIRTLGRSYIGGTKRNAIPSSALRNLGSLPHTAHQWPNKTLPTGTLIASAILASSIISQENKQSQSIECSALPEPPTSPATEHIIFAKPIKDINTIYKIGEVIGEGGFGQVYYATRIEDGNDVALKCIPKEWTLREEFQREIDVLQKLNNEDGGHPPPSHLWNV